MIWIMEKVGGLSDGNREIKARKGISGLWENSK